jgi:hypothetical protein
VPAAHKVSAIPVVAGYRANFSREGAINAVNNFCHNDCFKGLIIVYYLF